MVKSSWNVLIFNRKSNFPTCFYFFVVHMHGQETELFYKATKLSRNPHGCQRPERVLRPFRLQRSQRILVTKHPYTESGLASKTLTLAFQKYWTWTLCFGLHWSPGHLCLFSEFLIEILVQYPPLLSAESRDQDQQWYQWFTPRNIDLSA